MIKIIKFKDKISIWTDSKSEVFSINYRYCPLVSFLPSGYLVEMDCFESDLWLASQRNIYQFQNKIRDHYISDPQIIRVVNT